MKRIKLEIKNIVGNVFDYYSKQYQDLLNYFKAENKAANQFRDDIKAERISRNRENSLAKAYDLSGKLKKELISRLEAEKVKYIRINDDKKNEAAEQANKIFSGDNSTAALKLVYDSINKNTKVMQANKILEYGYTPAIEKLIDENEGNEDILQLVESYLNKNIEAANEGVSLKDAKGKYFNSDENTSDKYLKNTVEPKGTTVFDTLKVELQNARTTEVDDIDNMLRAVRYTDIQMDSFPILSEIGMVSSRSIPNDFNNNSAMSLQDAKDSYFQE